MEGNIIDQNNTKYCKHCGERIPIDAIICTRCGRQVEEMNMNNNGQPIIINNNTSSSASANIMNGMPMRREINKWTAFLLCLFLGVLGGHKFYEGKVGMGILYIFTCGLFGIGAIIDLIVILTKPNPYYVM